MANKFKKILAATLVAACAFNYVTPVSQLIVPASISFAAETDKITVDSALGATLSVAKGTATTINLPATENEMIDGVSTKVTYTVSTSNKSVVGLNQQKADGTYETLTDDSADYDASAAKKIQFVGVKGGKATIKITKKTATSVIGVQEVEVTVVEKSALTLVATGAVSDNTVSDVRTIKVYKGEALKIAATTTTAADQIDADKDFTTAVADSTVASVVTEDKTEKVGVIAPVNVAKEAVSGQTYTVFLTANKLGTTTVTIAQAAAKDSSTSATASTFNIEVIERDGELSASYDYDRDGKADTFKADTFSVDKFTTKEATKAVALDLKNNKTLQITGKSGNGQAVSYSSTDTSVATVSTTGLVTAAKKGTTVIKVTTAANSLGIKASEIDITVNVTENEVAYITVSGATSATTVGTYNGTAVPDLTVGEVVDNDTKAYTAVNTESKTIILSTKDKKTAGLQITSNATDAYLDVASSDTGIITYANGTITAVKAGAATLTIQTKDGAPVDSSSKVIINVYVTDHYLNNSISAEAVSVDAVNKTATIKASSTYGTVAFDGKIYKLDATTGKYDSGASAVDGVSIDTKGVVKFAPANASGTVYAKATVANSSDAIGAKDTYVAINYTATAANEITLTGAEKNALSIVAGKSASVTASATDAKTAFAVSSSDEEVATAAIENGVITITGVKAGTALIIVKGTAGTEGYANPESKAIAVTVTATATELKANTIKVTAKTPSIKAATLKKKNVTLAVSKVLTVKSAKGTVTYTKKSGNAKITISKTSGKVTVKKGLKKGTYTVKVSVKAAGNASYKAKTVTKSFKIKVK